LLRKLLQARATSHTSTFFSASLYRSAVPQNGSTEILRRRFPGGCSRSPGDRRRARRDVRLRASSLPWTPGVGTSSPWIAQDRSLQPGTSLLGSRIVDKCIVMRMLQQAVSEYPPAASYSKWTWIKGG
jgi:hypothetical protein